MRFPLPLFVLPLWTVTAFADPGATVDTEGSSVAADEAAAPSSAVTEAPAAAAAPVSDTTAPATPAAQREENCSDRIDNDGDTVFDCGDADCAKTDACQADGRPENTSERCSDFIDNDKDGATDCDDLECGRTAACKGSWKGSLSGKGGSDDESARFDGAEGEDRPAFAPETEAADSTDGVGFVGVRFGVVASILQSLTADNTDNPNEFQTALDTRINVLQLRAFGNLPLVEDSFFLINVRGERSPRLTFAMFQFPLGGGHYVNINSGGGTLSNQLIISAAKQPLLEPAYYVFNAFEQGNGAAVELHGPIVPGLLRYRVYAAGGAGFSAGNIGGRYFTFDNFNYTYSLGGQLQLNPIGYYSRFDSPFLYTPVPMALAINAGAKWDQRLQERFPAANVQAVFRWGFFEVYSEYYTKYELNFGTWQNAYNVMTGLLLWPEVLFASADFGQFLAGTPERPPADLETDLRRQRTETQARGALHWYFWRNNGILSLRYVGRFLDPPKVGPDADREDLFVTHEAWLAAQFRF